MVKNTATPKPPGASLSDTRWAAMTRGDGDGAQPVQARHPAVGGGDPPGREVERARPRLARPVPPAPAVHAPLALPAPRHPGAKRMTLD